MNSESVLDARSGGNRRRRTSRVGSADSTPGTRHDSPILLTPQPAIRRRACARRQRLGLPRNRLEPWQIIASEEPDALVAGGSRDKGGCCRPVLARGDTAVATIAKHGNAHVAARANGRAGGAAASTATIANHGNARAAARADGQVGGVAASAATIANHGKVRGTHGADCRRAAMGSLLRPDDDVRGLRMPRRLPPRPAAPIPGGSAACRRP